MIIQRIGKTEAGEVFHRFWWASPYRAVTSTVARNLAETTDAPSVFFMDRLSRGALLLAEAYARKGTLIVFEPSAREEPHLLREAIGLTHILKYSDELQEFVGDLRATPLLEIKTLADQGLRYRSRIPKCRSDGWAFLPPYAVPRIKDVAGAGDWCTSGIIHKLGQQALRGLLRMGPRELHDALNVGQALAAWNCQFEGARGGMYSVTPSKLWRHLDSIRANGARHEAQCRRSNPVVH
jgi:fructokinase